MVFDDDINQEQNVLKYIYMLEDHLKKLKHLMQGIQELEPKKFIRISEPIADDNFIFAQISSLSVILNPHNMVSQLKKEEKIDIILDTFGSFLAELNKEVTFNRSRFHSVSESYYNTIHLFLNILEGGFGAQFTLGAQSGITAKIEKANEEKQITPYVDLLNKFKRSEKNENKEIKPQRNEFGGYYDNE